MIMMFMIAIILFVIHMICGFATMIFIVTAIKRMHSNKQNGDSKIKKVLTILKYITNILENIENDNKTTDGK